MIQFVTGHLTLPHTTPSTTGV